MDQIEQTPVRVALVGSGRMGAFHGETLSRRVPAAQLVAVADPAPGTAERLAAEVGTDRARLEDDRGLPHEVQNLNDSGNGTPHLPH